MPHATFPIVSIFHIHLIHHFLQFKATVGVLRALSPLPQLYSAHLILVSGSFKHEMATDHALLIQAVLDAMNTKMATTDHWT